MKKTRSAAVTRDFGDCHTAVTRRGYTLFMNMNDKTALRGLLNGAAFAATLTAAFIAAMLAVRFAVPV